MFSLMDVLLPAPDTYLPVRMVAFFADFEFSRMLARDLRKLRYYSTCLSTHGQHGRRCLCPVPSLYAKLRFYCSRMYTQVLAMKKAASCADHLSCLEAAERKSSLVLSELTKHATLAMHWITHEHRDDTQCDVISKFDKHEQAHRRTRLPTVARTAK